MCKYKCPCGLCELTKEPCTIDDNDLSINQQTANKESKKLELLLEDLKYLRDIDSHQPVAECHPIKENI